MICWTGPSYDGDRRVGMSGLLEVGAIFPPIGRETGWRWMFFWGRYCPQNGKERTELAAKSAVDRCWVSFLHRAGLVEDRASLDRLNAMKGESDG